MRLLGKIREGFYNPSIMTRFHTVSVFVWAVFVPITLLTGLKDSIPWLAFLSVWALATGSWAALQAAHGEDEQDRLISEVRDDIEEFRQEFCEFRDEVLRRTYGDEP